MKIIFIFVLLLPLYTMAQKENDGVKWTNGLTWEQAKAKAKEESKYILVDCYATWCAPCKRMDKEVLALDSVGDYVNASFISLKVQMDVTGKDNQEIKNWYHDAEQIRQQFKIRGYPTYLFFSPEGTLTQKAEGYLPAHDFLWVARMAKLPGQVYEDPLARYDRLIREYEKGVKQYDSMYYMYETAASEGDKSMARKLKTDLNNYLGNLPKSQLFIPERLEYMRAVTTEATATWFPVFYKYSKKINSVMKDNNFAQRVVDKIILEEVAYPFLKIAPPGMMLMGAGMKADLVEADWVGLQKEIRKRFTSYYVDRNTLAARMVWYKNHWNLKAFLKTYFEYLDRYGVDSHEWTSPPLINEFSYNIVFLTMSDQSVMEKAIQWMGKVVEKKPHFHYLDTYASLLYKAGQKQEAIRWEERAWRDAVARQYARKDYFKTVLEKMKKGEKLNWAD